MKIFDIDYLANGELTDEDLHYLFDLNGITYSFIIYLLKLSGIEYGKNKFGKLLRKDSSLIENNFLSKKQIVDSKQKFKKCIMNIYQYGPETSQRWVEDWYIHYGLSSRVN